MARVCENEVKMKKNSREFSRRENLAGDWTKLFLKVPILFVNITLALLVSFILRQYFEPFICCGDFSHLLAWEKLSFVLYFSLVLESSSLSSDDFRQFLAWRAGPRLHVGSGANGFPHFLAPPLSPTFFRPGFWWQAHKKKMDQPTDRSWNLLQSEKKTKFAAHLSNPREIAYSVMVKFKETHDLAGRPFRWVFDPCQCSMYEVWMWSPNCAHYLRFQPSHRGLAIIDFRPKLMVLLSISVLITSLGNSGLQS